MKKKAASWFPLLLGVISLLAGSCAAPPVKVKEPPPPARGGRLSGTLTVQDPGLSLAGARVRVGEVEGTVGGDGTFSFSDAPGGKQSVVVEKRFSSGAVRRVMGVSVVHLGADPVSLRIPVRDATDIDRFCAECHPPLEKKTRRDQVARDVHFSGIIAVKANSDPSLLDGSGRVTCESCHTTHLEGKYPFFGLDDINAGKFCNRCHGGRRGR